MAPSLPAATMAEMRPCTLVTRRPTNVGDLWPLKDTRLAPEGIKEESAIHEDCQITHQCADIIFQLNRSKHLE